MGSRYAAAVAGLNARIMATFGHPVVLVTPDGRRFPMGGDWRQEPVLLDNGVHGAVSSYQGVIGIDLHAWPAGVQRIDADWSGWLVEIAPGDLPPDIPAGIWTVSNIQRPGAGWIDLEITNHIPAP